MIGTEQSTFHVVLSLGCELPLKACLHVRGSLSGLVSETFSERNVPLLIATVSVSGSRCKSFTHSLHISCLDHLFEFHHSRIMSNQDLLRIAIPHNCTLIKVFPSWVAICHGCKQRMCNQWFRCDTPGCRSQICYSCHKDVRVQKEAQYSIKLPGWWW